MRGGKRREEEKSPYSGVERQLLNTYFSGLYFSAKDMIELGKELNLKLPAKSRELTLKKIIAEANRSGDMPLFVEKLSSAIDSRVDEYKALLGGYPETQEVLMPLIQKAINTKKLLYRASSSPY